MNKINYLLLATMCFLISCKKDGVKSTGIVGQWQWVKSEGGLSNTTYTPQSTGKTWAITFTADSTYNETGTYITNSSGTYQLTSSTNLGALLIFHFSGGVMAQYTYTLSNDSLIFGNEYIDGMNNVFIRK